MKFENHEFIYADKYNSQDLPPVGEIQWTNETIENEIHFKAEIRGVLDSRESTIDDLKKELEELLKKYLI